MKQMHAVNLVLAEMCQKLDSAQATNETEGCSEGKNDVEIFLTALERNDGTSDMPYMDGNEDLNDDDVKIFVLNTQ